MTVVQCLCCSYSCHTCVCFGLLAVLQSVYELMFCLFVPLVSLYLLLGMSRPFGLCWSKDLHSVCCGLPRRFCRVCATFWPLDRSSMSWLLAQSCIWTSCLPLNSVWLWPAETFIRAADVFFYCLCLLARRELVKNTPVTGSFSLLVPLLPMDLQLQSLHMSGLITSLTCQAARCLQKVSAKCSLTPHVHFSCHSTKVWCDFLWLHLGAHSLSTVQHDLSWKSGRLWRCAVYTLSIQASAPWRRRGEGKKKTTLLCTLVTLFCSRAKVPHSPAERVSSQLRLNNARLKNRNVSICSIPWFSAQRSEGILAAVQSISDASSIKQCVIISGSVFIV